MAKRFKCEVPECGDAFETRQGRGVHMARIHGPKKWNNKGEIKAVEATRKPPSKLLTLGYECNKCDPVREFDTPQGLTMHNLRKHTKKKKKIEVMATLEPVPVRDELGDAARAILMAAQVLQAVGVGMNIRRGHGHH